MLGELELAYQLAKCLSIAITGTNGKGTTAELVERILLADHRRVLTAGHRARPACSVVEQTRELDFLIFQVKAQQLELTEFFRPTVAVLMNLAPDHLDRYATVADHERSLAGIFRNQQPFDWAVIQSAALAKLQALKVDVPSKLVTFSATDRAAAPQ